MFLRSTCSMGPALPLVYLTLRQESLETPVVDGNKPKAVHQLCRATVEIFLEEAELRDFKNTI